jgi:hypothetical protein
LLVGFVYFVYFVAGDPHDRKRTSSANSGNSCSCFSDYLTVPLILHFNFCRGEVEAAAT